MTDEGKEIVPVRHERVPGTRLHLIMESVIDLDAIAAFTEREGRAPSMAELQDSFTTYRVKLVTPKRDAAPAARVMLDGVKRRPDGFVNGYLQGWEARGEIGGKRRG